MMMNRYKIQLTDAGNISIFVNNPLFNPISRGVPTHKISQNATRICGFESLHIRQQTCTLHTSSEMSALRRCTQPNNDKIHNSRENNNNNNI